MRTRPSLISSLLGTILLAACAGDREPEEARPAPVVRRGPVPPASPFRSRALLEIPAASMEVWWMLRDLDGDRRPDIVVTADPDLRAFGHPGEPHWRFARNTGDGFAEPVPWRLPPGGHPDTGFNWKNFPAYSNLAPPHDEWFLVDLTGDRRPELVVTGRRDGGFHALGPPGARVLRVHQNRGEGFADAVEWPLPPGTDPEGEGVTYAPYADSLGRNPLRLMDLDGDGLRDLVVTAERVSPAAELRSPGHPGDPHWRFFRNLGGEFDAETAWPLPPEAPGGGDVTSADECAPDRPCWWLRDLNGDRRPDLVLTSLDGRTVLGGVDPAWLVHPNDGRGFGAAVHFPVPAPQEPGPGFLWLDAHWGEPPLACVTDLDGDDVPELVVTTRADSFDVPGAPARPHWLVYPVAGPGFSRTPVEWLVPTEASGGAHAPVTPADPREQLWGADSVALWDLDADGRRDLVLYGRDLEDGGWEVGYPDADHFTVFWSRP